MLSQYQPIFIQEAKEVIGSTEDAIASLEPKEYLHPDFWNEDTLELHPDVREKLLQVAQDFYKTLAIHSPLLDVQLSGSLANYGWSRYSDIDLHLIVNYDDVDENQELVEDYFKAKKTNWNDMHDIEIHSVPIEIYVQDSKADIASAGIYSVQDNKWVRTPEPGVFHLDSQEVTNKARALMDEVDNFLEVKDSEKAEEFWNKLKRYRDEGLEEGGEFSIGNLVWKTLRRNGYVQKIKDFQTEQYDKEHGLQ